MNGLWNLGQWQNDEPIEKWIYVKPYFFAKKGTTFQCESFRGKLSIKSSVKGYSDNSLAQRLERKGGKRKFSVRNTFGEKWSRYLVKIGIFPKLNKWIKWKERFPFSTTGSWKRHLIHKTERFRRLTIFFYYFFLLFKFPFFWNCFLSRSDISPWKKVRKV